MATVTLTRLGSGFANIPDAWEVGNERDADASSLITVETYVLPEDYTVAKGRDGGTYIYKGNEHCEIITHSCGRPQLVCSGRDMPVLDRA